MRVITIVRIGRSRWSECAVEAQYRNWTRDKAEPSNPHGAFINWAKTFVKKQAAAERDMAD